MNEAENSGKPASGSQKLAEVAFEALRRQLLTGALEPGAPLRLERLKRELGIGFTPLREALMRLSSEGLVDVEDIREQLFGDNLGGRSQVVNTAVLECDEVGR